MFLPFIWRLGSLGEAAFFNLPLAARLLCIFNKVLRQTDADRCVRLFFSRTNRLIRLPLFLSAFWRAWIFYTIFFRFFPSLLSTSSLSSAFFPSLFSPFYIFTQGSCRWFSLTASLGLIICIQINYLITDKCPAASPHSARQRCACNYFNHLLSSGAFLPYSCV